MLEHRYLFHDNLELGRASKDLGFGHFWLWASWKLFAWFEHLRKGKSASTSFSLSCKNCAQNCCEVQRFTLIKFINIPMYRCDLCLSSIHKPSLIHGALLSREPILWLSTFKVSQFNPTPRLERIMERVVSLLSILNYAACRLFTKEKW